MVESPTYYHAFNPVLKSLKRFDMENFQLKDEVIHALPSTQDLPDYLREVESLDASVVSTLNSYHRSFLGYFREKRMGVKEFLETLKCNGMKTPLEASQRDALIHAFENKLAIIQGKIVV